MIDREKVILHILSQIAVAKEINSDFITLTVGNGKTILKVFEEQQQIVRCKDCKHWEQYSDIPVIGNCPILDQSKREDWFCADGERKDDNA